MPSRTLACIECKCSGYGHLLFWGPARCVFVPQKPFCATKRLDPGAFTPRQFGSKVATRSYTKKQLHESPQEDTCVLSEMGRLPFPPPRQPRPAPADRTLQTLRRPHENGVHPCAHLRCEHFHVVTMDKIREDFVRRQTEYTATRAVLCDVPLVATLPHYPDRVEPFISPSLAPD